MIIIIYDYARLKGKIAEICGTHTIFAQKMGLSARTISLKLNNKVTFKQSEIQKAVNILGISDKEIQDYFFCFKSSIQTNYQ